MTPRLIESDYRTVHTNIKEDDVEKHEKLGCGSTSIVYRGTWNNKEVAIKEIHENDKNCFQKEKEILSTIAQFPKLQPYCINLYCFIENTKIYALVMEYIPGDTLSKYLQNATANVLNFHQISYDIACGLKYLHKNKIIHRDIKTDNIMITSNRAKIIDFGISFKEGEPSSSMSGTPAYMAPEIINGEKCSNKVDIYSYALLLFSMYSGTVNPYQDVDSVFALMYMVATKAKRPVFPKNKIFPKSINDLITKSWSHDPEQRPSAKSAAKYVKEMINTNKKILTLYAGLKDNSLFSVLPINVIGIIAKNMDDLNNKDSSYICIPT